MINLQKLAGIAMSLAVVSASATTPAPGKVDLGKREYESNCVVCHGTDGKGGAYVDFLKVAPPDLTQLAKRNGGVFPLERVYSVIDGRQQLGAHGPREMPIWGNEYLIKAGGYYVDVPYEPEVFIRARILSLIDYLYRMQNR